MLNIIFFIKDLSLRDSIENIFVEFIIWIIHSIKFHAESDLNLGDEKII
jgi:hypothetical protein